MPRFLTVLASAGLATVLAACSSLPAQPGRPVAETVERPALTPLFEDLQARTFRYFWETANEENGLVPDRYPYDEPFSSIAAVGFALTAYPIGVERGWITREQARDRTLTTMRFFRNAPQGPEPEGRAGHKGFFYHFLHLDTGHRYDSWVELSSVDTALLLGGMLFAQSYYDRDTPEEAEIRRLADEIYAAVDWTFLQERAPLISMGWFPESGIIANDWKGYNEAMLVYLLALASPTHPIQPEAWQAWTDGYEHSWGLFQEQEHLGFGPHFGHQYSHVWVDFRGIQDRYMRERGFDYFENSRRATYAQRAYAIANPMRWTGYGENVWGLTASDGPQVSELEFEGEPRKFRHYSARGGVGFPDEFDDGTIAPTAAAASLPFAPEIVIPAVEEMHRLYGAQIYSDYGFLDAFNKSFRYADIPLKSGQIIPDFGWVADQYIGIDQGPILAMIENYRNDFVWRVMRRNPHIRTGLERAGFVGGWLQRPADAAAPAGH
ncbi:glucoamylase family protein [Coralloluteibacterium thermophilus]|uniref:Glucoamylase family protein n=1 Tax=Coralloluteibacterium thermophilum TaxID=2707049 RepID=A0ABV9NLX4_9GAMM